MRACTSGMHRAQPRQPAGLTGRRAMKSPALVRATAASSTPSRPPASPSQPGSTAATERWRRCRANPPDATAQRRAGADACTSATNGRRRLADGAEPVDDCLQDLVDVARPPIVAGEDLDLVIAVVACRLDPAAHQRDVGHPVAHHAAVEQKVPGLAQEVADMPGVEPAPAGPRDLG